MPRSARSPGTLLAISSLNSLTVLSEKKGAFWDRQVPRCSCHSVMRTAVWDPCDQRATFGSGGQEFTKFTHFRVSPHAWKVGMATHSSILAWRIPWTEEPGGLQSIGCKEWDTTEATQHTYMQVRQISFLKLCPCGFHLALKSSSPKKVSLLLISHPDGFSQVNGWLARVHSKQNNGPSFFFIFIFWQRRVGHRILAPQGLNLCPPSMEVWSLNHWTIREVLTVPHF